MSIKCMTPLSPSMSALMTLARTAASPAGIRYTMPFSMETVMFCSVRRKGRQPVGRYEVRHAFRRLSDHGQRAAPVPPMALHGLPARLPTPQVGRWMGTHLAYRGRQNEAIDEVGSTEDGLHSVIKL